MLKVVQKYFVVCFLCFFCFTSVGLAEKPEKITSFTIECGKPVEDGFYGVPILELELGEETSCSLILDNKAIGFSTLAGNKLSSNLHTTPSKTIVVSPEHGETDGNGLFRFTVTAKKNGTEWVLWAIADKTGEFDFSKEALSKGLAFGMFVKIKK